ADENGAPPAHFAAPCHPIWKRHQQRAQQSLLWGYFSFSIMLLRVRPAARLLTKRAQKLVAGAQHEAGGTAMKVPERTIVVAVLLVLLQRLDAVEHIRAGAVPRRADRGLHRSDERVAIRQQGRGQRGALRTAQALSFDEQPGQAGMDR